MFCTKCGKPLAEGQKFCTGCGAAVTPAAEPVVTPAAEPTVTPAAEPVVTPTSVAAPTVTPTSVAAPAAEPVKKGKGGLVAGIVIALVVLAAAAAVCVLLLTGVLGGGEEDDEDRASQAPSVLPSAQVSAPAKESERAEMTAAPATEVPATEAPAAYDYTEMVGVYYCAQEPGSSLAFSLAGSQMSIYRLATGGGVDIQTVIDPPASPSFSIDYGGRVISFFYSASNQNVTVSESGHTFIYTVDGDLFWDQSPELSGTVFDDPDSYILPTNTRYLAESELYGYDRQQVRLIRNEIYARYGYSFTSQDLQSYFRGKSWYRENASVNANTFGLNSMNEFERANVELIQGYEKRMGW